VDDHITLPQLALHLQISERTIRRLVERRELPGFKVEGQWQFRRSVVDYWLDRRINRMGSADLVTIERDLHTRPLPLSDSLTVDNALIQVKRGASLLEAIHGFVSQIAFPEPTDRAAVLNEVWSREQLSTRAPTGGVALLHTARWGPRTLKQNLFAIGRISNAVASDEFDRPVDLLFMLLAKNSRQHLGVLARAVRLCRNEEFLAEIRAANAAVAAKELVRNAESWLFRNSPR
jgi:excisionase family DNA binding protein